MRSRFRVPALVVALALALGSCAYDAGRGIAELPASSGWEALPIGSWVLNDGLEARALVFCPRDACLHPGVAALLTFEGEQGRLMERALSERPEDLSRAFARLAAEKAAIKAQESRRPGSRTARPEPRRSTTDIVRFETAEAPGVLVTLRATGQTQRQAVTAILYGRQGDRLVVALGISEAAPAAREQALAAWRSR